MLQVDQPLAFCLLGLLIPVAWLAHRHLAIMDALHRFIITGIRCVLLLLVILALAGLQLVRRTENLTVIALVDVSPSVRLFPDLTSIRIDPGGGAASASPSATSTADPDEHQTADPDPRFSDNLDFLRWWLRSASSSRGPDDRFGIVAFDSQAVTIAAPTQGPYHDEGLDIRNGEGTDIAEALRMASALFGPETARRILLISDGNQTEGDALTALNELQTAMPPSPTSSPTSPAAPPAGTAPAVPVDVLPIEYRITREIMIERVEAPALARTGQRISVRVVIRATDESQALLTLFNEESPIDLNGEAPGYARPVSLRPGVNVEILPVTLAGQALNRFKAVIEPAATSLDTILVNNTGQTLTLTPTAGSILYVDGWSDSATPLTDPVSAESSPLPHILESAGFAVRVIGPDLFPSDMLELQAFDLVVLDDVNAEELDSDQHRLIDRYVRDLGGGLLMTGGYDSFGAGAWDESVVAGILPVDMKVPEELRVPTAALALVIDSSGSMARIVPGPRRSQQEIANDGAAAAIEALDPMDWISVIAFDSDYSVVVPLARRGDGLQHIQTVRRIRPEGGTNMAPALEHAVTLLRDVDAEVKHIVCLTDGRSQEADFQSIAASASGAGMTVSTIAVGDDIDGDLLQNIARTGNGRFYHVRNANLLPRIFVKDIQIVRRPLIREIQFTPVIRSTGSPVLEGLGSLPPLGGYVLTQPLRDPLLPAETILVTPQGEPLLATWQAGLGRTAAFTSDVHDRWAGQWLNWTGLRHFWVQVMRNTARPAGSDRYEIATSPAEGRITITLTDHQPESEMSLNQDVPSFVEARLFRPDGSEEAVRLPQQAPGTYSLEVPATEPGTYVVAATPREADGRLGLVLGGLNLAASAEYAQLTSNANLLTEMSRLTGGRILDLTAPESADLFNRDRIRPVEAYTPLWPLFAWAAAGLFLLDIAARRIAWQSEAVIRSVSGVWESDAVELAGRSRAAAAATARLRSLEQPEVKETLAGPGRLVDTAAGEMQADLPGLAAAAARPHEPLRRATSRPDPALIAKRRKDALAALRGDGFPAPKTKSDQTAPPPARPTDDPAPPEIPASDSMASKLRARLRSRSDSQPPEPPGA